MSLGYGGRVMVKIASSGGVSIYCPRDGRFSFFNSPYPAHRTYTAIDIYLNEDFGSIAPSPVSGEVKLIRRVACPEKKSFKSTNYDYVILMQSLENPKLWVKILHLEPLINVGDAVKVGDNLGALLRSGFFDYWTDPHMHVEIREPSDPIRARGGLRLKRNFTFNGENIGAVEEMRGVIVGLKPEYALMALDGDLMYGVPVEVCGEIGLIDGGIPHYGFFGVHIENEEKVSRGSSVKLCGREIGVVEHIHSGACVARCLNKSFEAKGVSVKLSFYLYLSRPLVKIIPNGSHRPRLEMLEEVSIAISS
ncbi:MAG: hypothetical protein QXH38_02035 [Candidatus Bathyarchaeia archaeon]